MTTPSFFSKGAYGVGSASAIATVPTGASAPQPGYVCLIVTESTDSNTAAGTPTTPAGWTQVFQESQGAGATGVTTLTIYGRQADGTEADTTINGVGNHISATMLVYQTDGTGSPWVVGSGNGADTGSGSILGITTPSASCLVVAIVGTSRDSISSTFFSGWSNSNLSNLTEREDNTTNTGAGGGFGVADGGLDAAGDSGQTDVTHATSLNWRGVHIVIKPAGGAGTVSGAAAIAGAGSLASAGTKRAQAQAAIAGAGSLTTDGFKRAQGSAAGNPFPSTPVLDGFNRANEGPPPSANWTNITNGLKVVGNECVGNVSAQNNISFYNALTYGPDVECYATVTSKIAAVDVYARMTTLSSATMDGYAVRLQPLSGEFGDIDRVEFHRIDNGSRTLLGDYIYEEFADGDGLGIWIVGSTIRAYRRSGGVWSKLGSRTDTTYSQAGYIGAGISGTLSAIDDFGGGTAGDSSLAGTGSLAAAGLKRAQGGAAIAGAGDLAAGGYIAKLGDASLDGTGSLTAAGLKRAEAQAAIAGAGSLTPSGMMRARGGAALAGAGGLSCAALLRISGTVSIAGAGNVAVSGLARLRGVIGIAGFGDLAATGTVSVPGAVSGEAVLSGIGSLSVESLVRRMGDVTIAGAGSLSGVATVRAIGGAGLAGTGSLGAVGYLRTLATAVLSGTGEVSLSGLVRAQGTVLLTGAGGLIAVGTTSGSTPSLPSITAQPIEFPGRTVAVEFESRSLVVAFPVRSVTEGPDSRPLILTFPVRSLVVTLGDTDDA